MADAIQVGDFVRVKVVPLWVNELKNELEGTVLEAYIRAFENNLEVEAIDEFGKLKLKLLAANGRQIDTFYVEQRHVERVDHPAR